MAVIETQQHHAYKFAGQIMLKSLNKQQDLIDTLEEANTALTKENTELKKILNPADRKAVKQHISESKNKPLKLTLPDQRKKKY